MCVCVCVGWITLRRYPLEVFGCDDTNALDIPVGKLESKLGTEEERSGNDKDRDAKERQAKEEKVWKDKVANLCAKLPCVIMVTPGVDADQETARLKETREMRVRPKSRENAIKNTEQRVTAGYKLPNFDISILDINDQAVEQDVLSANKLAPEQTAASVRQKVKNRQPFIVQMTVRRKSVDDNIFKHLADEVYNDKQTKTNPGISMHLIGLNRSKQSLVLKRTLLTRLYPRS